MGNNLKIIEKLKITYPNVRCMLDFENPFQLLIATILSAQCTDVRVNKVTPALFEAYPTPGDMALASESEIQEYIRTCGMYKTKSSNIKKTCEILCDRYNGEVPCDREALQSLPGVGRKTANVVLSNAYGIPAIAVDTHVFRVSNRLGLSKANNVEETERQLMRNIPESEWSHAHHLIITHGRAICHARKPNCENCVLRDLCDYYNEGKNENTYYNRG